MDPYGNRVISGGADEQNLAVSERMDRYASHRPLMSLHTGLGSALEVKNLRNALGIDKLLFLDNFVFAYAHILQLTKQSMQNALVQKQCFCMLFGNVCK